MYCSYKKRHKNVQVYPDVKVMSVMRSKLKKKTSLYLDIVKTRITQSNFHSVPAKCRLHGVTTEIN